MCLKRFSVVLLLVQLILVTPVFAREPNPKLVEEFVNQNQLAPLSKREALRIIKKQKV